MDWGGIARAILFALFAALTGVVTAVIEPTYDNLFVPEMSPAALYAPFLGSGHASNLFSEGAAFSNYILVNVVDPLSVLVIIVVGVLYLIRATLPSAASTWTHLAPRLVLGILLANMVLPLTWLLWSVASATYPVFYDYDGGAWQTFSNIVGPGAFTFSWDNGALAFVCSLTLFSLVLILTFLVAFRDALVAVLLVLLPPLTLLWPIPSLSGLAVKAWRLFAEMTFLPCLLVVPLALAVGASSILIVIGLFTVAVGMPVLLTQVGGSLSSAGFPHGGSIVAGGFLGGARGAGNAVAGGLQMGRQGFKDGYATDRERGHGGGQRISSGTLAATGGLLWGVGEGLGKVGRMVSSRAAAPIQAERTQPPPPLGRNMRIGA
jgi:hypothetical protein